VRQGRARVTANPAVVDLDAENVVQAPDDRRGQPSHRGQPPHFSEDWWPYGVAANRVTVDTYLRYHFEQGLSIRHLTCGDVFVPDLLET
jgi:hypothetical protein